MSCARLIRLTGRSGRRLLVLLALSGFAAATIVGCGAPGVPAGERRALARAYTATTGAGTAKVRLTIHTMSGSLSRTSTGTGAASWTAQRSRLTVRTTAASLPTTSTTIVEAGSATYIQVPASALSLTAGRPWAQVTTASGTTGVLGALALLDAEPSSASTGGPVALGTIRTTHLHAVLDPRHPVASADRTARADLAAWVKSRGRGKVTTDVYYDGSGRVRQLVLATTATLADGTSTGSKRVRVTTREELDLAEFGVSVDVMVPAPALVAGPDASRLFAGGLGAGG